MKKIDPSYTYNIAEIARLELFFSKRLHTVTSIVKKDALGENILKAGISHEGNGSRYKVKGKNIIKFLEKYGAGMEFKYQRT